MFTEYAFRVERASNRYLPKGSVWSLNYTSAPTDGTEQSGSYTIRYEAVTPVGTILHEVAGYKGTPEEVATQKGVYDRIMDTLRSVQKLQKVGLDSKTLFVQLKSSIATNGLQDIFVLKEDAKEVAFNKFTPKRQSDAVSTPSEPTTDVAPDEAKQEVTADTADAPKQEVEAETTKISKKPQKA